MWHKMQIMVMAMEILVSLFSCILGSATFLRESSISIQSSKNVFSVKVRISYNNYITWVVPLIFPATFSNVFVVLVFLVNVRGAVHQYNHQLTKSNLQEIQATLLQKRSDVKTCKEKKLRVTSQNHASCYVFLLLISFGIT